MSDPVDYEPLAAAPVRRRAARAADVRRRRRRVILPVPFDRTTSYVPGTRNGPRELLLASAQVELWDEEIGVDVHDARHVHAARDWISSARRWTTRWREISRVAGAAARHEQVPDHARRRAFDHLADRCGRGGEASTA